MNFKVLHCVNYGILRNSGMNLCEFRKHCYHCMLQSFIMIKLQWDCLILKLQFLRGKRIEPAPVLYAAVKQAITVCQCYTSLTHPSDDQLHYRWGQMNPVWRWCLAHMRVPHLCKSSSLCGLHPLRYINIWLTHISGLVLLKLENTKLLSFLCCKNRTLKNSFGR